MLQSNARGIALHLADIVTDEFRVLLDAEACPSSESGSSSSDPEREQDEEVRGTNTTASPLRDTFYCVLCLEHL